MSGRVTMIEIIVGSFISDLVPVKSRLSQDDVLLHILFNSVLKKNTVEEID